MRSISRRQFTHWAVFQGLLCGTSGCGTILYPERRGQPAGPLDWKVVALDAIGLLLFFVPGVIAFAVDFTTGTIYLPSGSYGQHETGDDDPQLVVIKKPNVRLTAQELESIVSAHAGRDVTLKPGEYQTRELERLEDFWTTRDRLEADDSADG